MAFLDINLTREETGSVKLDEFLVRIQLMNYKDNSQRIYKLQCWKNVKRIIPTYISVPGNK